MKGILLISLIAICLVSPSMSVDVRSSRSKGQRDIGNDNGNGNGNGYGQPHHHPYPTPTPSPSPSPSPSPTPSPTPPPTHTAVVIPSDLVGASSMSLAQAYVTDQRYKNDDVIWGRPKGIAFMFPGYHGEQVANLYPDGSSTYFVALLAVQSGWKLTFKGEFPHWFGASN